MRPVQQTLDGPPNGDCMRAALASILELPILRLPNFVTWPAEDEDGVGWWDQVNRWFASHLGVHLLDYPAEALEQGGWSDDEWGFPGYWKASVPSLNLEPNPETGRPRLHSVVMRGDKLAYDPCRAKRYDRVERADVRYGTIFHVLDVRLLRQPDLPDLPILGRGDEE